MTSNSKGSRRRNLTGRTANNSRKRFEVRVYAEGEKTEELYLTHWNRKHRDVNVAIARHEKSTPLELVKAAVDEAVRERSRSKRTGKAYDEYWCVFDVDEHPKLPEALALALANDIKVALSGPCLEVWFVLHYEDQTAHIHRHDVQRRAYTLMGCDGKSCMTQADVEVLDAMYAGAVARAKALHRKHSLDGASTPWNPCTNIWQLTEAIRNGKSSDGSGVPHRDPA